MSRFKRLLILCSSLFFIVGCNDYNAKIIDFLNEKKFQLFTYKNEYSEFSRLDKYDVFKNVSDIKIDVDAKYFCIALSSNDYDKNTFYTPSFFTSIHNILNRKNAYFILYGFESLLFLKGTEFDFLKNYDKPGVEYTIKDESLVFIYKEYVDGHTSTRYGVYDEKGLSSFESTIFTIVYSEVYGVEGGK